MKSHISLTDVLVAALMFAVTVAMPQELMANPVAITAATASGSAHLVLQHKAAQG